MKEKLFILCIFLSVLCYPDISFGKNRFHQQAFADTSIKTKENAEDKAIDAVVTSPKPPDKQQVKYFSQVTKYGFKDLFKNYSYNPAIPYSSQVNPNAETYMQDYLKAHGKYLEQMKTTALPYFNLIDGILQQYGLPKELKYLAVIESDLKSNALSVAGARGPWQFMIYTAKDYGLKVNQFTDDRTDYTKSTHAAARYLLSLYKNFKDWLLVIAAYNGGPERVNAAISKSGSRNFWKLQYFLPEESRNHVKKFIATHYIMETDTGVNNFNYASQNGEGENSSQPILSTSEISGSDSMKVSGRFISGVIAKNIEMNITDFNRYNPGFDGVLENGGTYTLRLPVDKMKYFSEHKYPILNECVNKLLGELNFTLDPTKSSIPKSKL